MAFIPANPQVGDKVRLTHDVRVIAGTYTRGHEFKIAEYTNRGGMLLVDKDGRTLETMPGTGLEKI